MMADVPPAVLGKRVGSAIKKKRTKHGHRHNFMAIGSLVGRALVRGGHAVELSSKLEAIEFRTGDDWNDWTDPRKLYGSLDSGSRAGLAGKVVSQAEVGIRITKDLHRAVTGQGNGDRSASAGNFKLTPNSRNTARITVGNDRRTRRPKYEWEKADTRRKIHKAIIAVGAPLIAGAGVALHQKGGGGPIFKGIAKGIGVVAKETGARAAEVTRGISAVVRGQSYTAPSKDVKSVTSASHKVAEMIKAKREATHAPTSNASGGPTVIDAKDKFKK